MARNKDLEKHGFLDRGFAGSRGEEGTPQKIISIANLRTSPPSAADWSDLPTSTTNYQNDNKPQQRMLSVLKGLSREQSHEQKGHHTRTSASLHLSWPGPTFPFSPPGHNIRELRKENKWRARYQALKFAHYKMQPGWLREPCLPQGSLAMWEHERDMEHMC